MSFLNDKTYEGMDWLSQAVEPYHCSINDYLAKMPEEYVLSHYDALSFITTSYGKSVNKSSVVMAVFYKYVENSTLGFYDERDILCRCFSLVTTGNVSINAENEEMIGEIKLVKLVNQVEDKDAIRLMRSAARLQLIATDCHTETLLDIGNLFFEGTDAFKEFNDLKSNKSRLNCILNYISYSAEKDSFKIRSVNAYKAFIKLVSNFLTTKNPKDLGEIYKVVIMAKRGQVIYQVGAAHAQGT